MKTISQIKKQIKAVMYDRVICCDEDEFNVLVKLEKQLRAELTTAYKNA